MEILIAATILSMMGALMWTSFSSTMDSKERIEAATDRMDELRVAMTRMSQEVSTAFISGHWAREDRRTKTIFKEASGGSGDKLIFSAFSGQPLMANANESDQTVITYMVDTDPDDGSSQALLRRYKRRVDQDPETEENTLTEVLCTQVKDIKFDFWNDATGEWKEGWDTDGIDTPNVLPKRVKITMTAVDHNGQDLKLVTQSPILLWQMLNF